MASRRTTLVKADCYRALQKCINNIMVINAPSGLYLQFVHLRDQQVPRKLFLDGEWFYCVTFTIALRRHGDSRATVLYNYLYPTGGWRFIEKRNAPGSGNHRDTNRDTLNRGRDGPRPIDFTPRNKSCSVDRINACSNSLFAFAQTERFDEQERFLWY